MIGPDGNRGLHLSSGSASRLKPGCGRWRRLPRAPRSGGVRRLRRCRLLRSSILSHGRRQPARPRVRRPNSRPQSSGSWLRFPLRVDRYVVSLRSPGTVRRIMRIGSTGCASLAGAIGSPAGSGAPTKKHAPRIKTALDLSRPSRNLAGRPLPNLLEPSMKTRAAVCRAFGAPLTIETIDLADPGPGEVRIKMAACAICHSDIFFLDGAWGGELPAVYGHEAAGVVEAVGPGVTRLKVGDHVVATLIRNCGFCPACAEGAPVFCEEVFPLDRATPLRDS